MIKKKNISLWRKKWISVNQSFLFKVEKFFTEGPTPATGVAILAMLIKDTVSGLLIQHLQFASNRVQQAEKMHSMYTEKWYSSTEMLFLSDITYLAL